MKRVNHYKNGYLQSKVRKLISLLKIRIIWCMEWNGMEK